MPDNSTKLPRLCLDCTTDISDRHRRAIYCDLCVRKRQRERPKRPNSCRICLTDISQRSWQAILCSPCSKQRRRELDKARQKERRRTPEYQELRAAYLAQPDVINRRLQYRQQPDVKQKDRARNRKPERQIARSETWHRRRARELGQLGTVTPGILKRRMREQRNKCYWCAKPFNTRRRATQDHYIALAKGGLHDDENIVATCQSCNSSKNAKDPLAYARETGRLF